MGCAQSGPLRAAVLSETMFHALCMQGAGRLCLN